jgi:ribonucleoside-diphosphate reductase alpha chain
MSQSIMDYIFRRLALDYLPFETRSAMGIYSAEERQRQLETGSYEPAPQEEYDEVPEAESLRASAPATVESAPVEADSAPAKPAGREARTSAELFEVMTGTETDAPLCFTCGTKMRPAGSCFVCEGCGATSGCS